jgi:outer membrane protein
MKNLSSHTIRFIIMFVACLGLVSCMSIERDMNDEYIGPRPVTTEAQEKIGDVKAPEQAIRSSSTEQKEPIRVTLQDAVLMALEHNRSLRIEKLNPPIARTAEDEKRAAFDPVLTGEYSQDRTKTERQIQGNQKKVDNDVSGELAVSNYLPTGTDVELSASTSQTWSDLYSDDLFASRVGLTITQALLRGAGIDYNLAALRQARLDTKASLYELRGFAESLIAQVETTYWDYALTQRQIDIFLESLRLAEQQKSETEEMIRIGSLAESELYAAEAEIALRREGLINARSTLQKTRLQFLRLLNPPGTDLWDRDIELLYLPTVPDVTLEDVKTHVDIGLKMRSDLNQARLQIQRGDLEIVKTKNGILPRMDVFIDLGKTGYAGSFGKSFDDIDGKSYDVLAGISLEFPIINREARGKHRRAILTRDQADEAVSNLAQIVQVDVRSAYLEVNRSKEQIAATAATRALQEEKARIEAEKFRVGKSTSILVAQAQRDLLSSRISEIQAIVNYLKSLIDLFFMEGSLLERRGIMAPGQEPVDY